MSAYWYCNPCEDIFCGISGIADTWEAACFIAVELVKSGQLDEYALLWSLGGIRCFIVHALPKPNQQTLVEEEYVFVHAGCDGSVRYTGSQGGLEGLIIGNPTADHDSSSLNPPCPVQLLLSSHAPDDRAILRARHYLLTSRPSGHAWNFISFNRVFLPFASRCRRLQALEPLKLDIVDDSGGEESKLTISIVSKSFAGMMTLKRHRSVYGLMADEMKIVHAVTLVTKTPEEAGM